MDCHEQGDRTEGVDSCSFESNKRCVGWNQPFSLDPHLLERRIVEDISRVSIVHKDLVGFAVPPIC